MSEPDAAGRRAVRNARRAGRVTYYIGAIGIAFLSLVVSSWFFGTMRGVLPVAAQEEEGASVLAIVGADGGTLFDAPGGAAANSLTPGAVLNAFGRTEEGNWVLVETINETRGWALASELVLFGINDLPVVFDAVPVPADTEVEDPEAEAPEAEDDAPVAPSPATPPAAEESDSAPDTATPTREPTAPPTPTMTPTPLPTATATPSPTPSPTVTPTPTDTPTPLPTPTPTLIIDEASGVMAVVRGRGAQLLETPGGSPVQPLGAGSTVDAYARTEDDSWYVVRSADGALGWISADNLIAFQVSELPRIALPEPPSAAADEMTTTQAEEEDATVDLSMPGATTAIMPATTVPTTDVRRPTPINPSGQTTVTVNMSGSRLNIRTGPGTSYAIVGKALPDEVFIALGRNQDGSWVQIDVPDIDAGVGWVSSQFILASDPLTSLPIAEPSAAPVSPTAPAAPTQSPAPGDPEPGDPEPDDTDATSESPTAESSTQPVSFAPVDSVNAAPAPGLSGTLVFQQHLGGPIYVYDLDTGSLHHLTGGMDPAISPDGSKVAFTRFGRQGGVFVIDIDGSNERHLYASDSQPRSAKWSPDGEWILFSRVTGTYGCRLVGPGICVKNNPFLRDFPKVNKDERYLSRIDLEGDNFRDLPALNPAYAPDWIDAGIVYHAPTSIEITYDSPDYEGFAVLKEQIGVQDPDWQPGGGRIAYQSKEGSHWEIFSVNPDGGDFRILTRPVTTLVDLLPSNVSPAWSPDGRYIAYVSNRDENNDAGPWRLWVMNADGSEQRPLPIDMDLEYAFNVEQMVSWGP